MHNKCVLFLAEIKPDDAAWATVSRIVESAIARLDDQFLLGNWFAENALSILSHRIRNVWQKGQKLNNLKEKINKKWMATCGFSEKWKMVFWKIMRSRTLFAVSSPRGHSAKGPSATFLDISCKNMSGDKEISCDPVFGKKHIPFIFKQKQRGPVL